jgi:hypothetical protein
MDCQKVYTGQIGRSFKIKYNKHIRSIRYNSEASGYATHILNNIHCYRKIEDIMDRPGQKRVDYDNKRKSAHLYSQKKTN